MAQAPNPPLDISRRPNAQDRKDPFGDLREKDGLSFGDIRLALALDQHVQPGEPEAPAREKHDRATLSGTPNALEMPHPSISGITWGNSHREGYGRLGHGLMGILLADIAILMGGNREILP